MRRIFIILLLLCASWARAAEVQLAWDANSEADLAGYKIHYGTASGSYTIHVDVGNVTTTTISGLSDGVRYYFAATAYSATVESGYSNEVNWQSGEPPPKIGATGLRASRYQVGSTTQMAIDCTLATASITYAGRTNSTISKPTGVVEGDDMLAFLYIESDTVVTAPAGWSDVTSLDLTAGAAWMRIYYKKAGASEDTSYTWTHSNAATQAAIKRFTGFNTTTLLDCAVGTTNGYANPIVSASITTVTNGAALIMVPISYGGDTYSAFTSPLVEYYDGGQFAIAAGLQATAGASGAKTATGTGDGSILMAIRPDGGGAAASAVPVSSRFAGMDPRGDRIGGLF